MLIQKDACTWNLGDTSFRRKNIMEDYFLLLKNLFEFRKSNQLWDATSQSSFYQYVLTNTHLFGTDLLDNATMSQRSRTKTNGLEKIGLCDKERMLTPVGTLYVELERLKKDDFEERLVLKNENILFLRQLLKLSIYDNTENSVNPFLFTLRFLAKYESIPQNHFKRILQSLKPSSDINLLMQQYAKVVKNEMTIDQYFEEYLYDFTDNPYIEQFIMTGEHFGDVFRNRKTSDLAVCYQKFYDAIINYKQNPNENTLQPLIVLLKDSKIKKAFSSNLYFDIPRGVINHSSFWQKNKDTALLQLYNNDFRKEFFRIFEESKINDLIDEYYDMTVRIFKLSGIISFDYGTVMLNNIYMKETFLFELAETVFEPIPRKMYDEYFYNNISSMEILHISSQNIQMIDSNIKEKYHLNEEVDIYTFVEVQAETRFEEMILQKFDKNTLIQILQYISKRQDVNVQKLVTDNATIPTIFEYIMEIVWYQLSNKKFNLLKSMNLSLDGNFLPLSHAVGGDGDIVINYQDHFSMLEVTLMDINTQKRGELEPVIRHSVNLSVEVQPLPVYTFFIANELDNNVVNIFRACNMLKLESSRRKGEYVSGTKIVSLTIQNIIDIINSDIFYEDILFTIKSMFLSDSPDMIVSESWRDTLIHKLLEQKKNN